RTNDACCSGVSLTIPQASPGPSVAKILLRTRKSGWFMCASSTASGRLSARLRNSSAVTVSLRRGEDVANRTALTIGLHALYYELACLRTTKRHGPGGQDLEGPSQMVVATSNSSELFGGRRPSVLPAK